MKAMLSTAIGGPDTLELTEMEVPEPKKGQVLVRIHAAGLNFPDTLMIRDMYQFKPPRPFAPGGEIAGEVLAVGDGVDNVASGDRVLALTSHGGYATHGIVDAGRVVKCIDHPFHLPGRKHLVAANIVVHIVLPIGHVATATGIPAAS